MAQSDSRITTIRIPAILAKRIDKAVDSKRVEMARYSMNDWMLAAIREKLDRGTEPERVTGGVQPNHTQFYEAGERIVIGREAMPSPAGFGKDVGAFLASKGSNGKGIIARDPNMGQYGPNSWGPTIEKLASQWAGDPGSVAEELNSLCSAHSIQLPGKFSSWHTMPKVRAAFIAWLDEKCPTVILEPPQGGTPEW